MHFLLNFLFINQWIPVTWMFSLLFSGIIMLLGDLLVENDKTNRVGKLFGHVGSGMFYTWGALTISLSLWLWICLLFNIK